jgi:hypothetical protein
MTILSDAELYITPNNLHPIKKKKLYLALKQNYIDCFLYDKSKKKSKS